MLKLYLQMFAEAGDVLTGTTTYVKSSTGALDAFDSVNTMTPTMKTYYDTQMLVNARSKHVFAQLGKPEALPAGEGMTVEWRKWNTLADAPELVEGVVPAGQKFGQSLLNVTIVEHGTYVALTRQIQLHATDPAVQGATEEIGAALGRTYEKLIRSALLEGANVLYADALNTSAANAYASTPSARHELSNAAATYCGLTVDMIAQAVNELEAADAPTYDGMNYVAVVHPDLAYDLRKTEGWIEAQEYGKTGRQFTNELGEINGVRFLKSTLAPVIRGADLTDEARTLTVASYSTSGGGADLNEITLVETLSIPQAAALEGREVIISGEHMTIISATAATPGRFIVSDADEAAWSVEPASPAVVYPGEGGALGISIYPVLFFAQDAFAVIDPEGAGMQTIIKTAAQIGGPLEQFGTVGGKFSGAAKILYPERLVSVECVSAYSGSRAQN